MAKYRFQSIKASALCLQLGERMVKKGRTEVPTLDKAQFEYGVYETEDGERAKELREHSGFKKTFIEITMDDQKVIQQAGQKVGR